MYGKSQRVRRSINKNGGANFLQILSYHILRHQSLSFIKVRTLQFALDKKLRNIFHGVQNIL